MNPEAMSWLKANWNPEVLPNNTWIAVVPAGILRQAESLEKLMQDLNREKLDNIVFCYTAFGIWQ